MIHRFLLAHVLAIITDYDRELDLVIDALDTQPWLRQDDRRLVRDQASRCLAKVSRLEWDLAIEFFRVSGVILREAHDFHGMQPVDSIVILDWKLDHVFFIIQYRSKSR